ncbi:DNA replication licensing factor mcm5 [Lamellibrachia satsuma]|nr:DNA replication licensing factor mcm5 [Lamellibrachia satsuma]
MAGFDDAGVFFSDNFGSEDQGDDPDRVNRQQVKTRLRDFIRQFHEGNFSYRYRDQLRRHYNLHQYWLEIDLDDVSSFDDLLAEKLTKQPTDHLPLFEEAAKEVADEVTRPRPEGEEELHDIQIMLKSTANAQTLRNMKSEMMSKIVKIPGIVIAASAIRAKATRISIQCRSCRNVINDIAVKPGLEGYALPRKCPTEQAGRPKCPIDPFFIVPDKCRCVDFQVLKLQEAPEAVPHGEMPRHLQMYADRYLCEKVVPGNRVTVVGIYSIRKAGKPKAGAREKVNVGIRQPYIRVIGIEVINEGSGRSSASTLLNRQDEEEMRLLAAIPNVYQTISKSIAPSIYGSIDIKKAIACLLFGGSRKRDGVFVTMLPDGLTRRGDINLLLLGDPGTAKSQLLKFVENCSPIGVYTSGKGSSAAGLTVSVTRDPVTHGFVVEGGAMVLADGGVVCIDEFDKMRENDRVAIHEAMEQQTISIAKAGITTTLNSRCSVLAAANSVFGRWDDTKAEENIDFMPTILSRFDMIFIVKDVHDEARDITLAKHVMGIHMNAIKTAEEERRGELDLNTLKKYVSFCRSRCGPRLSAEAAEKLKNRYVLMRNGAMEHETATGKRTSIPITVRQLEAIIRISESLAKMRLAPFATEADVDEALRLFQVSTLDAAMSGSLSGAEGFTTEDDQEMLSHIEKQLKRRFVIGSQVSEHAIVQDFLKQKYSERAVYKVLHFMLRRGELQHRMQRKMLYRLK